MNRARFRFYEELNDFLPHSRKKTPFTHSFEGNPSVKDVIESLGVPHSEVDLILVDGESVNFSYRLKDGDHISVYPVFETLDIFEAQHLRHRPLRNTRFILDVHLGRLARYLRMAGFDTYYDSGYDDETIISIASKEKRIILTRDKILLKNNRVERGYWIRSTEPRRQAQEVIGRFDLAGNMKPFTRCMECNSELLQVGKEDIEERLLPKTRKYFDVFMLCPGCSRIFWEGSHYERMKQFIEALRSVSTKF